MIIEILYRAETRIDILEEKIQLILSKNYTCLVIFILKPIWQLLKTETIQKRKKLFFVVIHNKFDLLKKVCAFKRIYDELKIICLDFPTISLTEEELLYTAHSKKQFRIFLRKLRTFLIKNNTDFFSLIRTNFINQFKIEFNFFYDNYL